MDMTLARRWWIPALRGVAAIGFAILTFISPGSSLFALVMLFGVYALVDGAFNLAMLARGPAGAPRWWAMIAQGVASILAGALTLLWPGISAFVLLMVLAGWSVAGGVAALISAVRLRKQIENEWLMALTGILSIAFGVLLFLFPGAGAVALMIWIGAYALVIGVLLLVLGLRLRSLRSSERPGGSRQVPVSPPPAPA